MHHLADPSERLTEIELVTQEIAEGKHYLVELDRRQNQWREARRRLLKHDPKENVYVLCSAGTFVQSEIGTAQTAQFFEERMKIGEQEIAAARESLKKKVAHLATLEGPDSAIAELYKGFDLKNNGDAATVLSVKRD